MLGNKFYLLIKNTVFIQNTKYIGVIEGRISLWDGLIGISLWDATTKSNFSLVLKPIEAWDVYHIILMYITLFTNKYTRLLVWFHRW